ncbi:hypothetical protein AGLY_000659 [Aphis glycines]|uniref:Uncharacterized protein n=1 Tax=Aphis glycines TaxID=307491 RepID=A0A6G0UA57_APHGL|nr:hypothetical protein AGLY_000659 [Aphis glycines]
MKTYMTHDNRKRLTFSKRYRNKNVSKNYLVGYNLKLRGRRVHLDNGFQLTFLKILDKQFRSINALNKQYRVTQFSIQNHTLKVKIECGKCRRHNHDSFIVNLSQLPSINLLIKCNTYLKPGLYMAFSVELIIHYFTYLYIGVVKHRLVVSAVCGDLSPAETHRYRNCYHSWSNQLSNKERLRAFSAKSEEMAMVKGGSAG